MAHSIHFCPSSFIYKFYTMSCLSGSRLLALGTPSSESLTSETPSIMNPHWNFSWLSCCCPESWRSCSYDSVWPVPSHTSAGPRWDRCLSGPTQRPECGFGNWVSQSRPLPGLLPFRQGSGSGTVLPYLGTSFLECMVRGGASSPACEIRSLFVAPSGGGNSPRAVKACLALLYPHHWGQFSREGWQLFCWRGERGVGTVFWCPGSQSQLFLVKKYWENA